MTTYLPQRARLAAAATLIALSLAGCGVKATVASAPDTTPDATATTAAPDTEAPPTAPPISGGHRGTTTPDTSPGSSGGSGAAASPKVAAYCKAVADFTREVQGAESDPSKLAGLAEDTQRLSALAQEAATGGLSPADTQAMAKCSEEAGQALSGGFNPGG
ncbi:MAG TPA: hypothetical protein VGM93_02390 [Acidimicrobiales bacterium]